MIVNTNMSVKDLMAYMKISQPTAYRLVHSESFYPAFRIGKKILINKDKLDKWIFEQSMGGGENSVKDN